ncbi:MAG: hypothetical protein IPP05_22250 [Cytophagaceae bacterium]|nr:hypothetical protein [Cytophagaceae bacterium]
MSVQGIDVKVLNEFGSKLVTIGFRKECDEWYSYSCGQKLSDGDVWKNAEKITRCIADMNALNWSKRYKESCTSDRDLVKIGNSEISVYQFLKTLQYIMYNCFDYEEYFNPYQKEVAVFLKDLEKDIMQNIIAMIPEYKEAKWSEI